MTDVESPPTTTDDVLQSIREKLARAFSFARSLKSLDLGPSTCQHKIDGLVYTSTKLAIPEGLSVLERGTSLVGPSLFRALAVGDGVDMRADLLTPLADRAVQHGLFNLSRDLLGRMKVNRYRHVPGSKGGDLQPEMDEHFAGEYPHLMRVCLFALAHNYRGPTLGGL